MQDNRLYTQLTYAGALPFIACAVLPVLGVEGLPNIGRLDRIAAIYGLAIASFVAGSHWGTYLYNRELSPINLFVTSNVVVLAAFFAFILTGTALTIFTLMLSFGYLLFVDLSLKRADLITDYYYGMRLRVTLIVLVSLAVILYKSVMPAALLTS